MTDPIQRLVGVFQLAEQPSGEPARSWIQVLVEGEFKHAVSGAFTITEKDLRGFAGDIQARHERIPIDFDHESAEGSTRAAGWYTGETRIDTDEEGRRALFAEVEWTPAGAAAVTSKEYRFISPEFSWKWRDAAGKVVEGFRMWATALTNRPFLPAMQPVALSEFGVRELATASRALLLADGDRIVWNPADGYQGLLERVTAELPLAPDGSLRFWVMDVAPKKALLQAYETGEAFVAPFTVSRGAVKLSPEEEWTRAQQEWVRAALAVVRGETIRLNDQPDPDPVPTHEGADDMKNIALALGLDAGANEETILAAVKTKLDAAAVPSDPIVARFLASENPGQILTRLMESAEKGEEAAKRLHVIERDQILAAAVTAGKLLPAQVESFAALYDLDPERVKATLDATPEKAYAAASHGSDGDGTDDGDGEKIPAAVRASFRDGTEGRPVEADEDGLRLHLAAVKILGKSSGYTADEYAAALDEASLAAA